MTTALIVWTTIGTLCLQDAGITASKDGRIIHAIQATIHANNFTYYRLETKSQFTIVVDTIRGDADLYVAEEDRQPHYQNLDYNISSITCGRELVVVSDTLKRPIVAGVLGHEQYPVSEYRMAVLRGEMTAADAAKIVLLPDPKNRQSTTSEKQSLLWDVISFMLKLVLEILL